MVMEAQPSPQSVGREFVRQYYTLLNQAPAHLHRFYNQDSLFVHGGFVSRDTDPVVGQRQIHQRIQQLNFRDCHAKILQVDSQITLGNGVVVQVSGEFSNGGQPMRRFTQTFVLAAETPKKYYVHNDIFRYQDMFGDEEIEPESGRTDEEEQQVDQERTVSEDISQQQNQNNQGGGYYGGVGVSAGVAINGGTHHDEVPVAPQAPQGIPPPMMQPIYPQTIDFHHLQQPQQQPPPPQQQQQQAPPQQLQTTPQPPPQLQPQQQQVTGVSIEQQVNQGQSGMTAAIPDVIPDVYQHPEQEEEEEEEAEEEATTAGAAITTEEHHEEEEEDNLKPSLDNNYPSLDQENDLPHETAPTTNEPSTYATRLKSGTSASGTTTNLNVSPQGPAKSPSSPSPGTRLDSRNELNLTSGRGQAAVRGGQRGGATVRGMSRGNDRPGQPRPIPSDDGNNFGDNDKRRSGPQQYPDNQQLFLGNLPLNATESDLRDLFGKFGPIIDLRIMNKPNMKGQTGNKLPNYGFIVFEDVSTVQTVLNSRPFFFPPENGTKLNVEEKKTRARGSTDGRIGSSGDVRPGARMGPGGAPSLRGGNRGGFLPGRGFTHGRGSTPMRPGGPSFIQRNSVQR